VRLYIVMMGENFDEAKSRHEGNFFSTVEEAVELAKMLLEPGQSFWVCDENGGVLYIGKAPKILGRA
jgi:hypothetical protein